jgi:hypothetical protein
VNNTDAAASNVIILPTASDQLVLVNPGDYTAVYVSHAGMHFFKGSKLKVNFRLFEHPDLVLPRWYRVTNYKGGRISAPVHSDLVREVSAALNQRLRHDRIPVGSLAGVLVRVKVKTVTTDREQGSISAVNRYSVISRLEGIA